jgi:DNA-binding NarL/FixJ family response regulator
MAPQDGRRPQAPIASALIIEDHPLFSDALAITLQSLIGIDAVKTAGSLEAALERLDAGPGPDIVLLDLNLPDVEGLDGLVRLKQAVGATPVLIVSSISEERTIAAALRAGAAGYVPKHSQRTVFAAAFETVARGEVFLPEGIVVPDQTGTQGCDDALRRLASLTPQQARILALICDGKLNKQIAWELSIAETTVKAHVTAIMRKLGVQSRTQAVLVAQETRFDTLSHG